MIEISISRELVDEHPAFMADYAEQHRDVQVVNTADRHPGRPVDGAAPSTERMKTTRCER